MRKKILNLKISDFLNSYKDGLDTAKKYGDFEAIVLYANRINLCNQMIDEMISVFGDAPELLDEMI